MARPRRPRRAALVVALAALAPLAGCGGGGGSIVTGLSALSQDNSTVDVESEWTFAGVRIHHIKIHRENPRGVTAPPALVITTAGTPAPTLMNPGPATPSIVAPPLTVAPQPAMPQPVAPGVLILPSR